MHDACWLCQCARNGGFRSDRPTNFPIGNRGKNGRNEGGLSAVDGLLARRSERRLATLTFFHRHRVTDGDGGNAAGPKNPDMTQGGAYHSVDASRRGMYHVIEYLCSGACEAEAHRRGGATTCTKSQRKLSRFPKSIG